MLKERKEVADISALGERELKIKVRAIGVEELARALKDCRNSLPTIATQSATANAKTLKP